MRQKEQLFMDISNQDNKKEAMPGRRPVWKSCLLHGLLIFVAAVFLLWLTTFWLDLWTHHGDSISVPDVKGRLFDRANDALSDEGFDVVLYDSVYEDGVAPGAVVDQNPKSSTNVKPGRTVYLTINAFYPRTVLVPVLTDMSVRQAKTILEGLGMKNVLIKEIPSEYKDLVYKATWNGNRLTPGIRVPLTAKIVLEVGSGYTIEDMIRDSISAASAVASEQLPEEESSDEIHSSPASEPVPASQADHDPDFFD